MKKRGQMLAGLLTFGLIAEAILIGFTHYKVSEELRSHIPEDSERPEDYSLTYGNVTLGTANRQIAGWVFQAENPKGGVVLLHGLGWPKGGKAHMLSHAQYLHENGWESVAIDFYSFGDSGGTKTTLGTDEWQDAFEAYRYLRSREELRGKPIGFLGVSMGAATALITAGKHQVGDFVIASVPYASIDGLLQQEIVHNGYPRVIFSVPMRITRQLLIPHPENAVDYIGRIQAPILIFEGTKDNTVPKGDAEKLVATSRHKAQLITFDAGHDINAEKPEAFRQAVLSFLATSVTKEH